MKKKKVVLVILDGWGVRKSKKNNAIKLANTPFFNSIWNTNPHTTLFAAQEYVGLPSGFIGNSEVGHIHLGGGRRISQELLKINNKIKDGSFFRNPVLLDAMMKAKHNDSALHLLGLLSDGGVHSHINHLISLIKMARKNGVKHAYIHCFLDGRDVPQKSAEKYIRLIEKTCSDVGLGKIATIMGRYYAMDRDNRWNREHKAYVAMVEGEGFVFNSAKDALKAAYNRGETDEFVKPSIILSSHRKLKHHVNENDSIIFFNFREDRARELTRAFVQGEFKKFKRRKLLNINFVCLTQYDKKIKAPVAFPPEIPMDILGEIVSKKGLWQLRVAETEKYAHVTYFFNGGREGPFGKEDRILVPSPMVSTYDLAPKMSAEKIALNSVKSISQNRYSLIIINFANADMVGHSGILEKTIKGVETVDFCLKKVVESARLNNYVVIVTADHGNAEDMSGRYKTSHTLNKVPFILISDNKYKIVERKENSIANVSATVLDLMGIKKPNCYFKSLIVW